MRLNVAKATDRAHQAALDAANGRARRHTLTDPREVRSFARQAEAALDALGLAKSHRRGTTVAHTSGKGLPSAYRYTGTAPHVQRVRGSRD